MTALGEWIRSEECLAVEFRVNARRGQDIFRSNLKQIESHCRVTGLRSIRHLRASHIKPWRKSDDEGALIPSPKLEPEVLTSWRIEPPINPEPFVDPQVEYLEYYREFIFQS